MAAIRRVLSSFCRGFIVVLLALLVGLAVPASAVADPFPTPSPSAAGDPTGATSPAMPVDQPSSADPSSADPSSADPSSADPSSADPSSAAPTPSASVAEPTAAPASTAAAPDDPTPTASARSTSDHVPAFTLTMTSDQPNGTLVWADQEVSYELVGTNTGDSRLDPVAISDDLSGVLQAATLEVDPVATITHGDGSTEPTLATLDGSRLTWTGPLAAGDSVRISYVVTVAQVGEATSLRNVVGATWPAADGSTQVSATAEASNPVNPVAIDDEHDSSRGGSAGELAATGIEGTAGLLAFAGLLLAFGMALVAVRRRD